MQRFVRSLGSLGGGLAGGLVGPAALAWLGMNVAWELEHRCALMVPVMPEPKPSLDDAANLELMNATLAAYEAARKAEPAARRLCRQNAPIVGNVARIAMFIIVVVASWRFARAASFA